MKNIILLTLFLSFEVYSITNNVVVTGDRVSIRLSPSLDGELLDRAMFGDHFSSLTKSNGWQGIIAPSYIPAWIHSNYVSNNIILAKKLNVRVGPNRNYGVLTVLSKGEEIIEIEKFNDWIKISPPSNSVVWISNDYLSNIVYHTDHDLEINHDSVSEELSEKVNFKGEDSEIINLSFNLNADMEQGLFIELEGILSPSKYGIYKLINENNEDICFVRGRKYQLESLVNKRLLLSGKKYFIDDLELPILQPNNIKVLNLNVN